MAYGSKKIGVPPPGAVGFKSSVRVLMSATQTISPDTITIVNFDDVGEDGLGEFNAATHKFIPKETGTYLLIFSACWQKTSVEADKKIRTSIFIGSSGISFEDKHTAIADWIVGKTTIIRKLNAGREITARVEQGGTGDWTLGNSTDGNYFEAHRIA